MPRFYRCPGCGRLVRAGKHFCSGDAETRMDDPFPAGRERPGLKLLKRAGIVLVAAALVFVLLIQSLGLYLSLILVGVAAIIVIAIILLKGTMDRSPRESPTDIHSLAKLLHGDSEAAERLVAAEMERYPEFTRQDCIRRVHDRLVYEASR